jgi:hypothetical protein
MRLLSFTAFFFGFLRSLAPQALHFQFSSCDVVYLNVLQLGHLSFRIIFYTALLPYRLGGHNATFCPVS